MSTFGVVVNPTSGLGRGRSVGEQTVAALRERGHEVVDLSRDSADEARAAARRAVAQGLDALVVVGGDGIVNLGVNVVAETDVPLGIVAAGTGNDVARSLDLPRHDVPHAVDAMLAALERGPRRVDLVSVGPPAYAARKWFVGVLSCGFDAAVNARANRLSWPRGALKYWVAILLELGAYKPYGYKVTADDATWESQGTLVAVGNSSQFGGGIKITPDARLDNGVLHVLTASGLTRRGILKVLPLVKAGRHLGHPACQVFETTSVLIEPVTRLGQAPPEAFADGEHVGPLPLRAQIHPGILRVLA
ncbi:MAG: diacylglycerol kinase family lipid kinase [Actinomycetales bacterium]|nr:diacylglycerol kinase family lipid kinase [Actinomycetales bacterium]